MSIQYFDNVLISKVPNSDEEQVLKVECNTNKVNLSIVRFPEINITKLSLAILSANIVIILISPLIFGDWWVLLFPFSLIPQIFIQIILSVAVFGNFYQKIRDREMMNTAGRSINHHLINEVDYFGLLVSNEPMTDTEKSNIISGQANLNDFNLDPQKSEKRDYTQIMIPTIITLSDQIIPLIDWDHYRDYKLLLRNAINNENITPLKKYQRIAGIYHGTISLIISLNKYYNLIPPNQPHFRTQKFDIVFDRSIRSQGSIPLHLKFTDFAEVDG